MSDAAIFAILALLIPAGQNVTEIQLEGSAKHCVMTRTDAGFSLTMYRDDKVLKTGTITGGKDSKGAFTMTGPDGKEESANIDDFRKALKPFTEKPKQELTFKDEKILVAAEDGKIRVEIGPADKKSLTFTLVSKDTASQPSSGPASQPTTFPTSAPTSRPAMAFQYIILKDVHGLWGGRNVWIHSNGQCIAQEVKPGSGQLQENRCETRLTEYGLKLVISQLESHHFETIQTKDRVGVPDEARPEIIVRLDNGKLISHSKWANDKHADFDAIYDLLLTLGVTKGVKPMWSGKYDPTWRPEWLKQDNPATGPASQPASGPAATQPHHLPVSNDKNSVTIDLEDGTEIVITIDADKLATYGVKGAGEFADVLRRRWLKEFAARDDVRNLPLKPIEVSPRKSVRLDSIASVTNRKVAPQPTSQTAASQPTAKQTIESFWKAFSTADLTLAQKSYADTVTLKSHHNLMKKEYGLVDKDGWSDDLTTSREKVFAGYEKMLKDIGKDKWVKAFSKIPAEKIDIAQAGENDKPFLETKKGDWFLSVLPARSEVLVFVFRADDNGALKVIAKKSDF